MKIKIVEYRLKNNVVISVKNLKISKNKRNINKPGGKLSKKANIPPVESP